MIVTVTIPIYKTKLEPYEQMALSIALDKFAQRDVAIVCPNTLDLSPLQHMFTPNCRVERFAPEYFAGREGYNRLMLSRDFYSRFAGSQFVLVCQTDVLIFRDELDHWCNQDYDYIGAPWLPAPAEVSGWNLLRRAGYNLRRPYGRLMPGFHAINLKWKVGNGGLSLRRVSAMLRVIDAHADDIAVIAANSHRVACFEDVFWGVGANERWQGSLRVPDATTAAHFAVEGHPDMAMRLTGGRLPMGAHAFQRRRHLKHWRRLAGIKLP